MEKIKISLIYVAIIITVFSCKKSSDQDSPFATPSLLITAKPWKLLSHGYDFNKDGLISSNEEDIKDCEKDNVSFFNTDGSGIVEENERVCNGDERYSHFSWSLINNDTMLDFNSGIAYIAKLSKDSLIITDTDLDPVKLMVIYGH